jgi:hypothetical protein
MEGTLSPNQEKFSSPHEELRFLREQVAIRERELAAKGAETNKEEVIADRLKDYHFAPTANTLNENYRMSKPMLEHLALRLAPEEHDSKISGLCPTPFKKRVIKNTLALVAAMSDAHIGG